MADQGTVRFGHLRVEAHGHLDGCVLTVEPADAIEQLDDLARFDGAGIATAPLGERARTMASAGIAQVRAATRI
jgi:hypothetical protein